MDAMQFLLQGGDSGPAVALDDLDSSLLLERLWLPLEDEDHMPPEGKPQLTTEELEQIRAWVVAGGAGGG